MKKQILLLSFCLLSISAVLAVPFSPVKLADDELIAKIKTALAPLFQENQDYVLNDVTITGASGGYKLTAKATFFQVSNVTLVGTFSSADVFARLELQFPDGSVLSESAQKKIAKESLSNWIPTDIRKVVALKSVYMVFAQNTISTIGIQFGGQRDWSPVNGIAAKNIVVDFNLNNPLTAVSISSTLNSILSLGDVNIDMRATLSSNPNDCVLIGDVSSLRLGNIMSTIGVPKAPEWPDAIWNLGMSKGSISIAPFAKTININTTSDFGQVEFMINAGTPQTQFMLGVAPPANFSFTRLDPTLGVLDKVGLKNTAIVLASSKQKTQLNIFKKLGSETEVTRGITLLALYNISEMSKEVANLIGKSQLLLRTTISNNPAELKLMASLDANIPFDAKSNVILKNVNFTIAPNPANFEVSLGGTMEVKAEKNRTLSFSTKVAVNITNAELSIEGIMNGTWDRPFDNNGVQLSNLGIGVGVSFKTTPLPMPTMQFKGKIKLGNPNSPAFAGDVTFALDPSNPTQCMVDAGFNQILMSDIIKIVQYSTPSFKVPDDSKNLVNAIAITDARLTLVPGITTVTVLEKTYDPGFLIKGKSTIDGYSTNLLVGISSGGIKASAGISAIVYPPYFSFTGALGKPHPYFNLVLSTTDPKSSKIAYSGKATVLKLTAESDMMLSDKGFDLYMKGKIFDKFMAQLQIAAGSTKDGAGYFVKAIMDSDLQKYISDIASAEIDKATKENQKAFREAKATLDQKQKEVATLNTEIDKQRAIVQGERDKDCKRFKDAEGDVKKAKSKVNSLKDDIDDNENKIKKLAKAMEADITKIPENGAKITKLKAEQVGMEAALVTSKAALKVTEKALQLLGAGCDLTPIDLDPRISGLITARETADKSLQVAKVIVSGTGAITGGSLKATKYIVEKGTTGVVTITYASFESKLSIADGGMVSMKVKGTYSNEPMDKSFTINLTSPQATVEAFARELLK